MPKQNLTDDEFIRQMTVGTLPEDAQSGTAEEAFRALVEGGQGYFGLDAARPGTEAYRTGQGLANLPVIGMPSAAVRAAGAIRGAASDALARFNQGRANPNAMMATAYHGSGNLFGELDPSKAKSGVGEQRYGAGAGYAAESRPVAEGFIGAEAQALRASGGMDPKLEFIYDLVSQKRPDSEILDLVAAKYGKGITFDEAFATLQKAKDLTRGYLYKGDIPDEILPSFLDWNKSLAQQPDVVKKLLRKDPLVKESVSPESWNKVSSGIIQKSEGKLDDLTGDSIYKYISLKLGSDQAATDYLNKLGVRGIRYADPGSKGLGRAPSGTSNFVVFNPSDYRIESVNDRPLQEMVKSRVVKKAEGGEVTNEDFIQQMMTGTPPTDQGSRPYDQTAVAQFADYLRAPVDLAQTAVRGTVGAVVGPAYGVYKGLTGGKYGTPEGVREASEAGGQLMQRITGEPQSQAARDVLEFIGKKAEEYKLAPTPQLMTLPVPGPGAVQYPLQAAKTQAEDIALRAVRSQTENPDITASQLYNAMLGKQAPGAAVVKPKGGNVIVENIDVIGGIPVRSSPIDNMRPRIGSGSFASDALQQMKQSFPPDVLGRMTEESRNFTLNAMKQLEPKAALDNWIQTKLGRYIRSDMGSEADPVRKLAEEMSTKVRADYETGLKRIAKMKDDIAKAKAQGKNTDLSEEALAAEIDKVENAYRQTSMLPVSIGPYTHPSSTNVKSRAMAGFPEEPISKSSLAKEWEEVADRQFYLHRAGDLVEADSPAFKANPWLANINPDEMVYMAPYVDEMHMFAHTLDELENALNPTSGLPQNLLLKPEDMQQLSIEKAFRLVNNINDWRLQQRTAANLEEAKRAAVTYKAYPDAPRKLQWQELKAPEYTKLPPGYALENIDYNTVALKDPSGKALTYIDGIASGKKDPLKEALQFLSKNDLERALKYEGSTMRHCVGGYCDYVWSGETRIFSLRDNKGEPHVTIEIVPPRVEQSDAETMLAFLQANPGNVVQRLGFDADDFAYVYRSGSTPAALKEFGGFIKNVMAAPEYKEWLSTLDRPAEIAQIKGKGNVKPTSSYIPFVQDFLTTQRWSRIRDLENADVVALKPMMLKNAQEKGFNPQILFEMNGESYITKEEFNRLAEKFGGINKMAAGGEVTNFIRAHA